VLCLRKKIMKLNKYKDWSIFLKIAVIAVITFILFLSLDLFYYHPMAENNLLAEKEKALVNVVDIVFTLFTEYEQRAKAGEFTLDEAKQRALTRVRHMRYKGEEYLWINDLQPKMLMHPFNTELEGKDLSGIMDSNGTYPFLEFVRVGKEKGEGFVSYRWARKGSTEPLDKISYIRLFKPWGWIIGTGLYRDDVKADMEDVRSNFRMWAIVTTLVGALSAMGFTFFIERRRTVEALQTNELKLKLVFNAANDGLLLVDAETKKFIDANDMICQMLGRPLEEIRKLGIADIHSEKDLPYVLDQFEKQAGGDIKLAADIPVKRKDGSIFYADISTGQVILGGKKYILGIFRDITERKQVEEKLKASLVEKEVLLREVHHRVKNNLQVISSLLNLQTDSIADHDVRAVFVETRDRVRSMSLVHEKLYQSNDLTTIDFSGYLETLGSHLLRSYERDTGVNLKLNTNGVSPGIDTVIPCGLIVTELVSNALKHAFPRGMRGEIWINLRQENGCRYILEVGNDGVAFPADVDYKNTNSLGLQLVMMLVKQLNGTITLSRKRGTEFNITFYDKKQRKEDGMMLETYAVAA
jgi:PAS domain S-box-containing protein